MKKKTTRGLALLLSVLLLALGLPLQGAANIPTVDVNDEDALKAALEATTADTITLTGNISTTGAITIGAAHLINLNGKELTLGAGVKFSGYQLTIGGGGTLTIDGCDANVNVAAPPSAINLASGSLALSGNTGNYAGSIGTAPNTTLVLPEGTLACDTAINGELVLQNVPLTIGTSKKLEFNQGSTLKVNIPINQSTTRDDLFAGSGDVQLNAPIKITDSRGWVYWMSVDYEFELIPKPNPPSQPVPEPEPEQEPITGTIAFGGAGGARDRTPWRQLYLTFQDENDQVWRVGSPEMTAGNHWADGYANWGGTTGLFYPTGSPPATVIAAGRALKVGEDYIYDRATGGILLLPGFLNDLPPGDYGVSIYIGGESMFIGTHATAVFSVELN